MDRHDASHDCRELQSKFVFELSVNLIHENIFLHSMNLLMLLHFTMTSPADVIALVDVIALHDDFFSFILFLYRVRHLVGYLYLVGDLRSIECLHIFAVAVAHTFGKAEIMKVNSHGK